MQRVEKLKDDMLAKLGDELESFVVFGSAASGETTKRFSDINVMMIVKDDGPKTLRALAPIVRRWRADGNPAPLVFSSGAFKRALDVFTIEFLDMSIARRVLHGADPLAGFQPDRAGLRQQLEFELRSKLLALQNGYFEAADNATRLRALMAKSLSSFTVLARTIVHLAAHRIPSTKVDAWKTLSELAHLEVDAVDVIRALREDDRHALKQDADALFGRYLELVRRMTDFVDGIDRRK